MELSFSLKISEIIRKTVEYKIVFVKADLFELICDASKIETLTFNLDGKNVFLFNVQEHIHSHIRKNKEQITSCTRGEYK